MYVNDLSLFDKGRGLLVGTSFGIQMWELSDLKDLKNQKKNLCSNLTKKTTSSGKKGNGYQKVSPSKRSDFKRKNKAVGSAAKKPEIQHFQDENLTQNEQSNFTTKYQFDFNKINTSKEVSGSKQNGERGNDLYFLNQRSVRQVKALVPPQNDPQVRFSFPQKGDMASRHLEEKKTKHYLQAENKITGFEKDLSRINGNP